MIKVINGAKYNTSTAKFQGGHGYSNPGDFSYWEESLYRTKAGKYFLHGEGGPMSKYAKSTGQNNWSGGSAILPMSRTSAMEWAEENLDGEEYEAIFGVIDEEEERTSLNLPISSQLKAKLWRIAESRGITISVLAEEVLMKAVEESTHVSVQYGNIL